ncbi:short-chain dehydrogenase/reductase SDR [Segniliparus rotundus DSM 44985]|uniref:Short-chain dehydrogenase/reductase SDR n=1 Tax=Segniliparus rotundus (strain ATCC BAA-972 / CDC 1076 / CIP 108378 / DSM 44985 / JCM 13578) TaxID=640132 RepID=D6ZFN4_SEGRD|nr:SDR family oxidoreductase [Segniliparus rotundus]ADG97758.1 short-chain dehydrogenase/reductase SDR [Segniliparus rotundus DSM 44985]
MGKRVLVTGAASGLGLQIAVRYARAGAKVLLTDVDEAAGEKARAQAAKHGEAVFRQLDVADPDAWSAAVAWCEREWGGLDILVNNAGVASAGEFEQITPEDWDWIITINLKGVVFGARVATELFKRQRSGHIVNVASLAGLMHLPGMASYNVTKAGVVSLSETLRHELKPYGVKTTVVCPAFFATNLTDRMRSTDPFFTEVTGKFMRGSKITAEQVADSVFQAVRRGTFLLVVPSEARRTYLFKKHMPRVVDVFIARGWGRARRSLAKSRGSVAG